MTEWMCTDRHVVICLGSIAALTDSFGAFCMEGFARRAFKLSAILWFLTNAAPYLVSNRQCQICTWVAFNALAGGESVDVTTYQLHS
jgi:hypothetical protein